METKQQRGLFLAKVYIGQEIFEDRGVLEAMAVRKASYKALVNTMYAFREIPDELLDFVRRREKGTLYLGIELTKLLKQTFH